ncbi:sarcosine oxidase subunit delta [Streptomyces sp. NPDC001292]|uniref:sarcosine oxidase subunit delta n=1 Tax=Streptomyces sp. NPDC001292 TaxID=3364558 RepID=UPI0036959DDC
MIQLPCPWCGPRNVSEFRHHGESTPRPDTASTTPQEWRHYLYFRRNARGWVDETWYHTAGCRRFFRVCRHTSTNETLPVGETR